MSIGLLRRSLGVAALVWVALAGLAWAVAGVEGAELGRSATMALAPLAWALGVAVAVEVSVRRGEWAGQAALGVSPLRRASALVVVGAVAGVFALIAPQPSLPGTALPAPIDPAAQQWPSGEGWSTPDLAAWTTPPGELSWSELRSRREPPPGARTGADRAEALRRIGYAASWPLASLLGLVFGARVRRRRPMGLAVAGAGTAQLSWQLLCAVAVAYCSSMT